MPIIDLTLELHDNMSTHPAHARCVVLEFANHTFTAPRFQAPCRRFASKVLMFSDHIGTHVDAPFHYFPEKETIEAVKPAQLIGSAVYLDLSAALEHWHHCRAMGFGLCAGDVHARIGIPGP